MRVYFVEVEFSCDEVGDGDEVLCLISSGLSFGSLDNGVQAFQDTIIDL